MFTGIRHKIVPLLTVIFTGVLQSGCKDNKIKSIAVKQPEHIYEERNFRPDTNRFASGDLLLAYIVPTSSGQWFIKSSVIKEELPEVQKQLKLIERTLIIDDHSVDIISYKLANGWKKEKGSEFLHSKITNPKLRSEITFSKAGGSLLANINRWNGKHKFPKITAEQLPKVASERLVNKRYAIYVSLPMKKVVENKAKTSEIEGTKSSVPAMNFTVPTGWKELPPSGMRKVDLRAGTVEISAIPLPAQMQNLEMNIARWARQIQMRALTPEDQAKALKDISISGIKSKYIELVGAQKTILVALCQHNDKMWFFKAMGTNAETQKQRVKFKDFLTSIELKGAQ